MFDTVCYQSGVAAARWVLQLHTSATQGSSSTALALFLACNCARSLQMKSQLACACVYAANMPALLHALCLDFGSDSVQVRFNDLKIGGNVGRWRGCRGGGKLCDNVHSFPTQLLQRVRHTNTRAVVRVYKRQ